jgi:hypothetical protein
MSGGLHRAPQLGLGAATRWRHTSRSWDPGLTLGNSGVRKRRACHPLESHNSLFFPLNAGRKKRHKGASAVFRIQFLRTNHHPDRTRATLSPALFTSRILTCLPFQRVLSISDNSPLIAS